MKVAEFICVLILLNCCIVNSISLNLGSFFHSRSDTTSPDPRELPPDKLPEVERNEEENVSSYSSESYEEYRSDSDSYNSTFDQEFMNLLSRNSTSESNGTSQDGSVPTQKGLVSSEPSSPVHSSSESPSDSTNVTWNKVSTPVHPPSTTLGQIAAANFTTEEQEEVVLVTGETTKEPGTRTIFQKSLDWMKDEYTLSILLPVTAGVIFALTIICTIAMCRCMRRCCRRRRFRKKCLPDSVRSLSASDRARLLGDTSDEEF